MEENSQKTIYRKVKLKPISKGDLLKVDPNVEWLFVGLKVLKNYDTLKVVEIKKGLATLQPVVDGNVMSKKYSRKIKLVNIYKYNDDDDLIISQQFQVTFNLVPYFKV